MDVKAYKKLFVYTREDCDKLCAILCRNGYFTVAQSLEIVPKRWCVSYYDLKEECTDA